MSDKKLSFEENLKNLEDIIQKLQKGDIGLEESISLFESGVKYANECRKELEKAKEKIITLTELEKEADLGD